MDVLELKDTLLPQRGPDFPQISTQKAILVVKCGITVNQLNLAALKFSYLVDFG